MAVSDDYQPFFDDLQDQYNKLSNFDKEFVNSNYERLYNTLVDCQENNSKETLKKMTKKIKLVGHDDIIFSGMFVIVQDVIYYSISKLNPQMFEVNKFFVSYLIERDTILNPEFTHYKTFYLGFTSRSPWFREYIQNYVSLEIDELESSHLFTFFMCPGNLTKFGEEHLSEILLEFENKMEEYEEQNGLTISRSCYIGPRRMNVSKLMNILEQTTRECENIVRAKKGLPNVGEGFIKETKLFNQLKTHYVATKIIHHGRFDFLGKLHYDIWIPKYKIAIEYQGEQHTKPVEYFGGEAAFATQKERDERKRELCAKNGVTLICVEKGYDYFGLLKRIKGVKNSM
jgi:hypothetical protein